MPDVSAKRESPLRTLVAASRALESGRTTSESLLAACLERIEDPAGEGRRAYITVHRDRARKEAARSDAARARGEPQGALAGLPISIKDLFDEAGETTTAGSRVLQGRPPAQRDAAVVSQLRAAGAIVVGRTNMTEFAYSGVGLNPHYGTPLSPYDRRTGRISGGSTSGGAVAVADGMCWAAIGSDTGGSLRIPAAFCGVVGYKPTQHRWSAQGAFPLAPSFDTVGVIAPSIEDCRLLDAVIGETSAPYANKPPREIAIGVALGLPFADLEAHVATTLERTIASLSAAGIRVSDVKTIDWSLPGQLLARGRISAVECRACHGDLFDRRAEYDPRVAARIDLAAAVPAVDYARALRAIGELRVDIAARTEEFDAVLLPTVACVPPPLADLADDRDYFRINDRVLRNTSIGNVLGFCAVSIPVSAAGEAPVGLMLMAAAGRDALLLGVAASIEALVRRQTHE